MARAASIRATPLSAGCTHTGTGQHNPAIHACSLISWSAHYPCNISQMILWTGGLSYELASGHPGCACP